MKEKRRYSRSPFHLETDVHKVSNDSQKIKQSIRCKCKDISDGGFSFFSEEYFKKGDIVRAMFLLPKSRAYEEVGDEESIKVLAKVMYSRQVGNQEQCLTGLKFLNIYQQDYELLCSYIVDTMGNRSQYIVSSTSPCLSTKNSLNWKK